MNTNYIDEPKFETGQMVKFKSDPALLDSTQKGQAGRLGRIISKEPCFRGFYYEIKVGGRILSAYAKRFDAI